MLPAAISNDSIISTHEQQPIYKNAQTSRRLSSVQGRPHESSLLIGLSMDSSYMCISLRISIAICTTSTQRWDTATVNDLVSTQEQRITHRDAQSFGVTEQYPLRAPRALLVHQALFGYTSDSNIALYCNRYSGETSLWEESHGVHYLTL